MKKILVIAIALTSLQGIAQERQRGQRQEIRKERAQTLRNLSPDQAATLQTKKMTLQLDLSDAQQKEIYKMNLANAKNRQAKMDAAKKMRKSGEKLSKEAKYELTNERLAQQIANNKKLKSILTQEQFDKLQKASKQKQMKRRKQVKQRGKSKQRFKKS